MTNTELKISMALNLFSHISKIFIDFFSENGICSIANNNRDNETKYAFNKIIG